MSRFDGLFLGLLFTLLYLIFFIDGKIEQSRHQDAIHKLNRIAMKLECGEGWPVIVEGKFTACTNDPQENMGWYPGNNDSR